MRAAVARLVQSTKESTFYKTLNSSNVIAAECDWWEAGGGGGGGKGNVPSTKGTHLTLNTDPRPVPVVLLLSSRQNTCSIAYKLLV